VHLPMSLVGPFIKAPKSGLPGLWREFQKDPLWFAKFADFNRCLFEAKLQKAQTACITSSIDGLVCAIEEKRKREDVASVV
jgi:hypothetical protein